MREDFARRKDERQQRPGAESGQEKRYRGWQVVTGVKVRVHILTDLKAARRAQAAALRAPTTVARILDRQAGYEASSMLST